MICLCGVDEEQDADARVLREAVQKTVQIKMQMGSSVSGGALKHQLGDRSMTVSSLLQHQISLARAQGSRLVVEQEVGAPGHFVVPPAARLQTSEAGNSKEGCLIVGLQCNLMDQLIVQSPSLHASQGEVAQAFITDPACHLDVIYWHQDVQLVAAQVTSLPFPHSKLDIFSNSLLLSQDVFNQFCAYDNTNPLAKFYFLEVGQSFERLHQVRFSSCLL
ncbi:hypothetical protein GQ600_13263 [Phytophthora cactorum]|nr:hypothetical protein GQ600_13263 [Phytophthora cactorum]